MKIKYLTIKEEYDLLSSSLKKPMNKIINKFDLEALRKELQRIGFKYSIINNEKKLGVFQWEK